MMLLKCCVSDLANLEQSEEIDVGRCKTCSGAVPMPYVVELIRQRAVAQDAHARVTRERDVVVPYAGMGEQATDDDARQAGAV